MKNLFQIFLLIFLSYFLSGCSAKKLTVRTLHPSKIEKEKINTVLVERFRNDDVNQTISLKNKIANKIVDNQRVFTLKNDIFGTDAIITGEVLNSSVAFQTYYRNEIDYSRCRFYRYDEKSKTKHCIEYAIRYIPCENRTYNVTTNIQVIKPINNSVIFSKTYDKSSYETECYDRPPYSFPYFPHTRLSFDKHRINSQIADEIASDILDDISPHYVYFNINIIEELDDENLIYTKEQRNRFENIVNLIEDTRLDIAKAELEILDKELNQKSFEVIYNLALIYEAYGKLEIANNLYNQAKTLTSNVEYLDLINYGINRTNINLEEKIKAKSQLP
ncbi:MAG: hypothetical protein RBQ84_01290 [Arcobacter sp.]|jgi:hypothetical protein|uniref:hypothetical protein n=1 Tax=Arcobacter sp. TaxID=1872629 RepID=UPI002A74CBA5|nr:hypothetical protein [Arcobacter sp.]MDY3199569.1 hypothetical protein [Arcobacter sp.]